MNTRNLLLLALIAPGFAHGGTPIDQTRAVDKDARIEITNVKGLVRVGVWDKPEVHVTGTLGSGSRGLTLEGSGSHLEVKVEGPDESKGWFHWGSDARMEDSRLELQVPRQAALEINVVSADVDVGETAGRSVKVDSVSGRIKLATRASRLEVDAVSGDVEFDGKADDTHIETVSGDIRARNVGSEAHAETVSGNIRIESGEPLRNIDASSVSGDIDIRGGLAGGGRVHVESMSGDIRLRVPGNLSAHLEADSFSGRLKSDFGTVEKPEHGPGSHLDTRVGSGDGRISLESFSGDVTVEKE